MSRDVFWNFSDISSTNAAFCSEMDFIIAHLEKDVSESIPDRRNLCVAVSGGSDSLALLLLIANWAHKKNFSVKCVTVDHKLRQESSEEARFVADFCNKLNIEHATLEWDHRANHIDHGKLENLAREARYGLIDDFCKRNSIKIVAIAHTWNDQLETFEMRKDQKSDDSGLAGMSRIHSISDTTRVIRPVLYFTKKHLREFLIDQNFSWKEDPMNEDTHFKRVFYRKNIANFSQEQLEQNTKIIKSLGEKRRWIELKAKAFLHENLQKFFFQYGYSSIEKTKLFAEDTEVQKEILKRLIWSIGGKKYASKISESVVTVIHNFGSECTIGRCLLRSNKKHLYLFRENRNLAETISFENDEIYFFDNRFLLDIKFSKKEEATEAKYMILSQSSFGKLSGKKDNIPQAAFYGFPCIVRNEKLVFAYGSSNIESYPLLVSCKFKHKVNLFDIFL